MGMFKILGATLIIASVSFVAATMAQTQAPPAQHRPPPAAGTPAAKDKIVQGEVRSIHPAGTEITLTDGTRLVVPPGAALRPGVLAEGMTVIASYMEENGEKVLTELAVKEPSASPPTGPRSPGGPSTAPPSAPPKRY